MYSRSRLLVLVYSVLDHIPNTVWAVLHVISDIIFFWLRRFVDYVRPRSRTMYYQAMMELEECDDFNEWYSKAMLVDEITGADLWRRNFFSKRYDFNSILEEYTVLTEALDDGKSGLILKRLANTGPTMLRNFAGIVDKRLFTKSLCGTKLLIEQYLNKVLECLQFLDKRKTTPTSFFQRCRLSLGTTALILHGGSLFGLYHLGVIKGLLMQELLPNIISGSSMGGCIAALCCCLTNQELKTILSGNELLSLIKQDLTLLRNCGYGNIDENLTLGTLVRNVIHKGYSKDVYLFIQFVKKTLICDLTFEEALQKTGKLLTIVIHPTDINVCPTLLNYVTTPNVLISSAIDCTLGSDVISLNTKLLCKNLKNEIVDYIPDDKVHDIRYLAPQDANKTYLSGSPYTRLTELFNVNNFIVSLARPYLAPLVINDLKHEIKTSKYYYYKTYPSSDLDSYSHNQILNINNVEPLTFKFKYHLERKIKQILTMEIRHRVEVLDQLGLLSTWIKNFAIDEKTPRSATELTIVPTLKSISVSRIIEGQLSNIPYWIRCGEQSCWSILPLIKTRCAVEFAIYDIIRKRRK